MDSSGNKNQLDWPGVVLVLGVLAVVIGGSLGLFWIMAGGH